jgi:multiple sugar transport system ATP-binding protein
VSGIRLDGITKRFDDLTALRDLSLTVHDGEFFVLLGPTGAGKTTTLRVIAGLERQEEGAVYFDEHLMNEIPPADRDTAFVFQQYSLYPNMTVYENMAFPLKSPLRNLDKGEIDRRIRETAETLRITQLLDRKTANLSGGEMQRVSIGRAIVREPRVFLMDEPLSNLDAKLRESLRVELEHLQKTQGITTIFVTHDQIEALTMADRLAVLNEGHIVQVGTPEDIYDRPATTFVAQLVGTPRINLVEAQRRNGALKMTKGAVELPYEDSAVSLPETFLLGIRPEDITLRTDGEFKGEVVLTEPLGVETIVHLKTGEERLLAVVPGTKHIAIGEAVSFEIVTDHLHFFGADQKRLGEVVGE